MRASGRTPNVMSQRPRAIVCGAGAAGLLHALAYRARGVEVVAVFDPDADRAATLASLCGARSVPTLDALLAVDAEIASVCSPPRVHVEHALAAARSGRHVFVEKPVATSEEDLARLAAAPRCVPIVQWRAGRALRAVRAAIASGALGPSPSVGVELAWSRDAAYFAAGRGTSAAWGCGALLSVGVHAIDAVVWAMGRPLAGVRGTVGGATRDGVDVETSAVLQLAFDGGGLASLRVTFDGGGDTTRLTFCGGGVTAEICGGEGDPTASKVRWTAVDDATRARLDDLERAARGALAPPLIVPFLGEALGAIEAGLRPGSCDALPAIADVRAAHAAALAVYASAAAAASASGEASGPASVHDAA